MIIDFESINNTLIPNFYGGEKQINAKIFADENNKIMYGKLEPGAFIGVHTHKTNSEIIYILRGEGKVLYDGEYKEIKTGMCHYCPKLHSHSLINESNKDLIFFAVVTEQ